MHNANEAQLVEHWHMVLGHPGLERLLAMTDNPDFKNFTLSKEALRRHWKDCSACQMSKTPRITLEKESPFPKPTRCGEKVLMDEYGGFEVQGAGGYNWTITFMDSFSTYILPVFLAKPNDIFISNLSLQHVQDEYRLFGHHLQLIVFDASRIENSPLFIRQTTKLGIQTRAASPNVHEELGQLERYHGTLRRTITTMFAAAPWTPPNLWTYALLLASYNWNLLPNTRTKDKAPMTLFQGKPVDFANHVFLSFGQPVLTIKPRRQWKHDQKMETMLYLSPAPRTPGSIVVYNPRTHKVSIRL